MIFKGLEIKESYEKVNDVYQFVFKGQFNVRSEKGDSISLVVTPDLCQKLLDVCADAIVDVATEAAESLRTRVIEGLSVKQLENKEKTNA